VAAREERVAVLTREAAALAARLDTPPAIAPRELRAQVETLSAQVARLGSDVTAAAARVQEAEAAARRAAEETAAANKRLAKKDEKNARLKEQLAAAGAGGSKDKDAKGGSSAAGAATPANGGAGAPAEAGGGRLGAMQQQKLSLLDKMMTCSVCHERYKEVVISKCYHLFCKKCIDDNLKSRHRKCPACGLAFGENDVKTVYFS
jgi:outer membrane murein-binding lipoprotein Lpp